jgi:hypothetical protein
VKLEKNEPDDKQEHKQCVQPAQLLPTAVKQLASEEPQYEQLRYHQQAGLQAL